MCIDLFVGVVVVAMIIIIIIIPLLIGGVRFGVIVSFSHIYLFCFLHITHIQ